MTIQDGRLDRLHRRPHHQRGRARRSCESLQAELGVPTVEFHAGVSYRNLMVYRGQPGERPGSATRR